MRLHSIYELFCYCSHFIITEEKEFICPKCGRHGEIQRDDENYKKLFEKQPKTITEMSLEEIKCPACATKRYHTSEENKKFHPMSDKALEPNVKPAVILNKSCKLKDTRE